MLSIFSYVCRPFVCLLGRSVCSDLLPIFWLDGLFFRYYWVVWVLCIFWILGPYWRHCLQMYFPIWMIVSLPCWQFLLLSRSFLVWCSSIHYFCFYFPWFWGQIHNIFFKSKVLEVSAYVFFYAFYCFRSYIQVLNPFWVTFDVWW